MKLLWDAIGTEFGGRHELYEINWSARRKRSAATACSARWPPATGKMVGFAEQCMAEYDINGWNVPDLQDPGELSYHVMRAKNR